MSTQTLQNPSVFLYGPGDAKVEDSPLPTITDPHDVIVRVAYVGVCGSDVHFWTQGGVQTKVTPSHPLILGHEATATIQSTGSLVTSLKPGDRVALEPSHPCRLCHACKSGSYHFCPNMRFASSPPSNHGFLSKFIKLPQDFCYSLPENIGLQEGALVEPLAVAVHVAKLGGVKLGDRMVIFGAGTVGLLCAAVCRAMGASAVVSVDINSERLAFARKFAATNTYLPLSTQSAGEISSAIIEQNGFGDRGGADVVLEATGAEKCIEAGIHVLRMGGTFVQAGLGREKIAFPIVALSEKEICLRGSFRYGPGDFEMAVELLKEGNVSVKELISEVVPFERVIEGWERTREGLGIKNLIEGPRD